MRFSCYNWNPKRFHPEFNGIATRYSTNKKQRLTQQRRRKQLDSDYAYTTKLDSSLEKALQSKTLELFKLQQAKQRHLSDLRFKQQLFQQRQRQIQSLRIRNSRNRLEIKNGIASAKNHLIYRNTESRVKLKNDLSKLNEKFQKIIQKSMEEVSTKHKQIQQDEVWAKQKVDNFHRQKNQMSVNYYLDRIRQEKRARREQQMKIKKYERKLTQLNKTVQTKKAYLNEVQDQIFKLKTNIKTFNSGSIIRSRVRRLTESSDQSKQKIPLQDLDKVYLNPQNSMNGYDWPK